MTVAITVVDRTHLKELIVKSPSIAITEDEIKALDACLCISQDIYAGFVNDEIACVWGLVAPTIMSDRAYLWLYTTILVDEHKFLFVRHSQRWLERALENYGTIVGFCKADNERAIRWIRWLGGNFQPVVKGRVDFEIRKDHGRSLNANSG